MQSLLEVPKHFGFVLSLPRVKGVVLCEELKQTGGTFTFPDCQGGKCNSLAPHLPFCISCFHPVSNYHVIPDPASHLVNPTPFTCL